MFYGSNGILSIQFNYLSRKNFANVTITPMSKIEPWRRTNSTSCQFGVLSSFQLNWMVLVCVYAQRAVYFVCVWGSFDQKTIVLNYSSNQLHIYNTFSFLYYTETNIKHHLVFSVVSFLSFTFGLVSVFCL